MPYTGAEQTKNITVTGEIPPTDLTTILMVMLPIAIGVALTSGS